MDRKKFTPAQRNAMHLYFRMVAKAFQDKHIDMKMLLEAKPLEMPVTEAMVKESIWKPILKAVEGKDSTEDMDTVEPSEIYDIMNRWLINTFEISVPWPSEESQFQDQR